MPHKGDDVIGAGSFSEIKNVLTPLFISQGSLRIALTVEQLLWLQGGREFLITESCCHWNDVTSSGHFWKLNTSFFQPPPAASNVNEPKGTAKHFEWGTGNFFDIPKTGMADNISLMQPKATQQDFDNERWNYPGTLRGPLMCTLSFRCLGFIELGAMEETFHTYMLIIIEDVNSCQVSVYVFSPINETPHPLMKKCFSKWIGNYNNSPHFWCISYNCKLYSRIVPNAVFKLYTGRYHIG